MPYVEHMHRALIAGSDGADQSFVRCSLTDPNSPVCDVISGLSVSVSTTVPPRVMIDPLPIDPLCAGENDDIPQGLPGGHITVASATLIYPSCVSAIGGLRGELGGRAR
jgi:hypothetical protein